MPSIRLEELPEGARVGQAELLAAWPRDPVLDLASPAPRWEAGGCRAHPQVTRHPWVSCPELCRDRLMLFKESLATAYGDVATHKLMLTDTVRTEAYRRAIEAVVRPRHRVLDFGCGTGILSLFAARAGAKTVYAIDQSPMIRAATAIARDNGFDNITFIYGDDETVALPHRVDVLVSEWMGNFVFGDLMLEPLLRLRDRFLKKGGSMIPERITLYAALLRDEALYDDLSYFRRRPYGFDYSHVGDWSFQRTAVLQLAPGQVLEPSVEVATFDLHTLKHVPKVLEATVTSQTAAAVYGICGWFDVHLAQDIAFGTGPSAAPTHWHQVLFPLREPFQVSPDRPVRIRLRPLRDPTGTGVLWQWSISDGAHTMEMDDFSHLAQVT